MGETGLKLGREKYIEVMQLVAPFLKLDPEEDLTEMIEAGAEDLAERVSTFGLDSDYIKEQPKQNDSLIIFDLGAGDFPHYYALFDHFDKFTYVAIEQNFPEDVKALAEVIKKTNPSFHLIEANLLNADEISHKLQQAIGTDKADLILMEHLAIGSDAFSEDKMKPLLKYIITKLIPHLLSETGSIHIESVGPHQRKLIQKILDNFIKTYPMHISISNDNLNCHREYPELTPSLRR